MGEYDKSTALALRLIKKKGRPAVIRRFAAASPPDPAMPWRPGQSTPTDEPCFAVVLEIGLAGTGDGYLQGTQVPVGDRQILIPASGLSSPPRLEDLVVFEGEEPWTIIPPIGETAPAGDPILYTLQVRR